MAETVKVEKKTIITIGEGRTLELKTEREAELLRDRLLELYPIKHPSMWKVFINTFKGVKITREK